MFYAAPVRSDWLRCLLTDEGEPIGPVLKQPLEFVVQFVVCTVLQLPCNVADFLVAAFCEFEVVDGVVFHGVVCFSVAR